MPTAHMQHLLHHYSPYSESTRSLQHKSRKNDIAVASLLAMFSQYTISTAHDQSVYHFSCPCPPKIYQLSCPCTDCTTFHLPMSTPNTTSHANVPSVYHIYCSCSGRTPSYLAMSNQNATLLYMYRLCTISPAHVNPPYIKWSNV